MRRSTILLLLVLAIPLACADGAAGDGTTGIEGRVTIGPQCPVMQAGSPCPDAPYEATVRVLRDGSVIATGRSTPDGSFHIAVAPGRYEVDAVPLEGNGIASAHPQASAVVTADGYTRVDLSVDSGIR
jgi:hypothetical protein